MRFLLYKLWPWHSRLLDPHPASEGTCTAIQCQGCRGLTHHIFSFAVTARAGRIGTERTRFCPECLDKSGELWMDPVEVPILLAVAQEREQARREYVIDGHTVNMLDGCDCKRFFFRGSCRHYEAAMQQHRIATERPNLLDPHPVGEGTPEPTAKDVTDKALDIMARERDRAQALTEQEPVTCPTCLDAVRDADRKFDILHEYPGTHEEAIVARARRAHAYQRERGLTCDGDALGSTERRV